MPRGSFQGTTLSPRALKYVADTTEEKEKVLEGGQMNRAQRYPASIRAGGLMCPFGTASGSINTPFERFSTPDEVKTDSAVLRVWKDRLIGGYRLL